MNPMIMNHFLCFFVMWCEFLIWRYHVSSHRCTSSQSQSSSSSQINTNRHQRPGISFLLYISTSLGFSSTFDAIDTVQPWFLFVGCLVTIEKRNTPECEKINITVTLLSGSNVLYLHFLGQESWCLKTRYQRHPLTNAESWRGLFTPCTGVLLFDPFCLPFYLKNQIRCVK